MSSSVSNSQARRGAQRESRLGPGPPQAMPSGSLLSWEELFKGLGSQPEVTKSLTEEELGRTVSHTRFPKSKWQVIHRPSNCY